MGTQRWASSFVILNYYEPDSDVVQFNTLSGVLTVRKNGSLYEMDFPTYELSEIPVTDAMEAAFGIRPVKAVLGLDLICVFETEEQVRSMHPDQELLKGIEGRIQNATAAGKDTDCVSRSFCPKLAVAEDPVCGSAHCQIADYWSGELGKKTIYAYQASTRGGYLYCELLENGRISSAEKRCWWRYRILLLNYQVNTGDSFGVKSVAGLRQRRNPVDLFLRNYVDLFENSLKGLLANASEEIIKRDRCKMAFHC